MFATFLFCFAINAQNMESDHVRAQVTKFIKSEFDGEIDARIDMASYNKIVTNSENLVGNRENRIISIDHTTLHLVRGYKVKKIERNNDAWIVTVEFDEIAAMYGDEPNRRLENADNKDCLRYRMITKQDGLYVFEPPAPRISLEAMIRLMSRAIKLDEARQSNKAIPNKPRKETVEYRRTMLNALEKLKE
jgi:hypothetical protein